MKAKIILVAIFVTLLTGCATTHKPSVYSEQSIGYKAYVTRGKVESVRFVEIQGDNSGIGAGTGMLLGGAAGYNTIGKGSGRAYGAILGAILGYAASKGIEKTVTSRKGIELTVFTETRSRYVIVQDDDGTVFVPGDAVNIIDSAGKTRVVK